MILSVELMDWTVARVHLDSSGGKASTDRRTRNLSRAWEVLRCGRIALGSFFSCLPLLLARHPRTPLRLLCVSAFEYVARLNGAQLDRTARMAIACACDFGALRNDFYDQGNLDRKAYRRLRLRLRHLVPETATRRYIRNLRNAERRRPAFGPDGFSKPAAVMEYRVQVLVLSIAWLQVISGRAMEPRFFRSLVALVGLLQLVDDLLDWKDDWACRRPTYVTAFLHDWASPSRRFVTHIPLHAKRFRGVLRTAFKRDAGAAPLTMAGLLVWFLAVTLMEIRFPR
jgi:hypothetical protein